ncbi:MAG: FlgO family outer membrane protein [Candidatus Udaeobacter sp.]
MTLAHLRMVEETFHAALGCEPRQLSAFLDTTCAGDEILRGKVEALLASHQRAGSFIQTPVAALAATIVENGQAGLLIGQMIGHFKILKPIGAGGMGEVYLASDITVGRSAALKILPSYLTHDTDRLKRFQQEARVVAGLNHPNIVTVYEAGVHDSVQYIASELIEGETLRQCLARGPVQLDEAVEIALQVANALAAAHQAGVVHRDIKPENVMLRPDGYAKVLDFGIAKLAEREVPSAMEGKQTLLLADTNLGAIVGSVRYMSPEQARHADRRIDRRTDIWSLGAMLYEMVTGHAPFTGDTPSEIIAAMLATKPPPLSSYRKQVPRELQQIVSKALRKNPDERYQNAKELLDALKALRHNLEFAAELKCSAATRLWLGWTRSPTAVGLTLLGAVLAAACLFYWVGKPTNNPVPEKSIAVLPFEYLSDDKQNSFFADGVQDEILSDLAKVADLKVISRTSVMQYKGGIARNLREIGRQLGVAHVLEGNVERSGNRVRVNAQLIDARTDQHLWGQIYDRDISDVFAIQNEIAETIVGQLQAKLSSSETEAIERFPTSDITAFDLYTRAKNLLLRTRIDSNERMNLLQAADLLNQAVSRDPSFFDAYCQLAWAHDFLYFLGHDHTSARLALAEAAIQAASRLRPDVGETHLARAQNLYWGYLDYDGALAELEVVRQTLPNEPRLFQLKAFIERRQGRWEEAIRSFERTIALDPRNLFTLQQTAHSHELLRRYAEEKSVYDRILAIDPNDAVTKAERALVELNCQANTAPLHETIDAIQATNPAGMPAIADEWLMCGLGERDAIAAKNALIALGENRSNLGSDSVSLTRLFVEGVIARMTKDDAKARSVFIAARAEQEKTVQAQPDYGPALCVLGLIDAGLGRKEEALREGRRAVELLPVEKDSINGTAIIKYLAMIAAWVGDKDLACEQLAIVIRYPSGLSYGQLKLLPFWDPLRGDPRFEQIVASLAPKAN